MNGNPEEGKRKAMMLVKIGMLFAVVGMLLVWTAFYMEFAGPYTDIADGTSSRFLATLKLGGIGHMLFGIFLSLMAIAKILGMMPQGLKMALGK